MKKTPTAAPIAIPPGPSNISVSSKHICLWTRWPSCPIAKICFYSPFFFLHLTLLLTESRRPRKAAAIFHAISHS